MSFDRVGTIIGIILGVASFAPLFCKGYTAFGLLAVLIVLGLVYHYWDAFVQSDFTILTTRTTYKIEDESGSKATSKKVMKVRANHKGLSRYVHRNISADGNVKGFRTNYGSIETQLKGGDYTVYHTFPVKLGKWQSYEFDLIIEFEDSFVGDPEAVIMLVDSRTKSGEMRVELPETRPCKDARIYYRHGIEERQLQPPIISPDRRQITWSKKRLNKIGSEYEIEWNW